MASGIVKTLAKHLECAVCLERIKEPKMLTCQHTFCRGCLERSVVTDDQGKCEVTCPECKEKTEILSGGTVKSLPTNFFINQLLSELKLDGQSVNTPICKKHEGEELKLFCPTCDQLICRDCTVIDHRDHRYKFINDMYPAERKKIEKAVGELRSKIVNLEASLKTLDKQEHDDQIKCNDLSFQVDAFINKQIELLEEKRKSLKNEIQELALVQNKKRNRQKKSFSSSLCSLKRSVEFADQILKSGKKVEVLAAKKEIMANVTDNKSIRAETHSMNSYYFEIGSPLNNEIVQKIAKIGKPHRETTNSRRGRSQPYTRSREGFNYNRGDSVDYGGYDGYYYHSFSSLNDINKG